MFRFKWGYLAFQNDEADGDTPASISASIYVDAALEDPDLLACFADVFTEELEAILEQDIMWEATSTLISPIVTDGDRWCAAEIMFCLDGAPEVVREKWVEIGKVLAALVERLGDDIQQFVAEANSQEEAGQ